MLNGEFVVNHPWSRNRPNMVGPPFTSFRTGICQATNALAGTVMAMTISAIIFTKNEEPRTLIGPNTTGENPHG
jgi:hypothetical protein